MTVTEYATLKGISTQAVSNHLKRYKKELSNHVKMRGRSRVLDEFAVDFLNQKVTGARVTVYDGTKDEEIKGLQIENNKLQQQLIQIQQEYLQSQDRAHALEVEKLRIEGAAEQKDEKIKNLESVAEQIGAELEQAQAERDRANEKMERLQTRRLTIRERLTGRLQTTDTK